MGGGAAVVGGVVVGGVVLDVVLEVELDDDVLDEEPGAALVVVVDAGASPGAGSLNGTGALGPPTT